MLKVDRALIAGVGADPDDTDVAAAVISIGRALGMRVIAEGVETHQQASTLRDLGCAEAQGYYFSRPLTACAIDAYLDRTLAGPPPVI
jgi:EAL domain-containing protein (putative c-di-GMP-specific phosphodiesterase class I)